MAKTLEELSKLEAQVLEDEERKYGSKNRQRRLRRGKSDDDGSWERFLELYDPGWKEAGLEEAVSGVFARLHERRGKWNNCPSCGIASKPVKYTPSILEATFDIAGIMAKIFNGSMFLGPTAFKVARDFLGFFTGEEFRSTPLLMCTACKRYCSECPYCSVLNVMANKIKEDNETMGCANCNRSYAVSIGNWSPDW